MERLDLNRKQKEAAEAETSVAVTAGAGTGKTAMLSHRYLHHVKVDDLSPLAIVAVTFTDKAAAELRSKIRKVLIAENADEKTIAELEAAQISTIHSLSARICRDHYDLAGLPPDFQIMDEITSKLWELEKFDEAIGMVDPDIVRRLGFSFMCSAVAELLKDPYRSDKALEKGSAEWKQILADKFQKEWEILQATAEFADCEAIFRTYSGKPGDTLEKARVDYLNAFADARSQNSVLPIYEVRGRHRAGERIGIASNWDTYALEQIRAAYNAMLAYIPKERKDREKFIFNEHDDAAAELIEPLAGAYRTVREYLQKEKIANKLLDFNDLELYAREILGHKSAVRHYAERWKAILVDEFQDTNPIQAEIIERISAGTKLTIVGDEKQSIYGFRGADVEVFGRFRKHIADVHGGSEVALELSYRTHTALVERSNDIFAPLLGEIHQPLISGRNEEKYPPASPPPITLHVADGEGSIDDLRVEESEFIADEIAKLLAKGVKPRDIAVLGRTWAPLDIYMDALLERGIPAAHLGGGSLLETREAKDVYALLQFVSRPEDNLPLVALLRSPFFAVSDARLLAVAIKYNKAEFVWWDAIRRRPEFKNEVSMLSELIDRSRVLSADELVAFADEMTGYSAIIANLPQPKRRYADLVGTREFIRRLAEEGRADVFGVVRSLRELLHAKAEVERPQLEAGNAVSLMTIHKAKGLEWNYVFVPDLDHGSSSSSSQLMIDADIGVTLSVEGDGHDRQKGAIFNLINERRKELEQKEMRRLIYVAITRAKDRVFLSSAGVKGRGTTALKLLRPALESAGIEEIAITSDGQNSRDVVSPVYAADIYEELLETIPAVPASVTATGLSVYAKCPKQFRYQFIEGHPGIAGESGTNAAKIGTYTHEALSGEFYSVETLRDFSVDANDDELAEALQLATVFRESPKYDGVRSDLAEYEVPFKTSVGGLNMHGHADYVTEDLVLDFKTDAEMNPDEHQFQLWAYAKAFDKQRAFIAYLRCDKLHEWSGESFAALDAAAHALAERILAGDHTATPSETVCTYCPFKTICPESLVR